MVVLSAAICTKTGKALMSRQFVEMTRIRIEGLLAAFPKLLGSDSKQHTFVETESVRYVYQPMENLYLLLITNKASNIIQDLDTLRLLSKVVPDVAGTANNLTEEKVTDKCFELLFAFDEVITAGGYREPINLQQIRTNLEMESHEEKLHKMIQISKMESARDQAKDAAKVIRERQRDMAKQGISMQGIGGGGPTYSDQSSVQSTSFREPERESVPVYSESRKPAAVKGMSLSSKGTKNKSLEDALMTEDKLAPVVSSRATVGHTAAVEPQHAVVQQPVMLAVTEKINARITRDGVVETFEIKGSLSLTVSNDDAGLCSVQMKSGSNVDQFTFNTHPKINKGAYDKSGLLQLKDTNKGFPSARPVGILKWAFSTNSDSDMIPIKINCWPEEESRGNMIVSIEYSMDVPSLTLHDVDIHIPLGTASPINVVTVDGSYKHSASNHEVVWQLPLIDSSNSTGSFEFTIKQNSTDAFFPINVNFSSPQLFCAVDVASVTTTDGASPIQYGITKLMSSDEYTIE
mmetsp:Transcript_20821/g.29932  ORF Transcript_20821/g.29932 Transcript_20821/m.29932 type:complete len:519 (-) Transcript_20821:146-1702(-)|eukprot:CAMPEP_0185029200 /NCGR_PEP_ID=MMETSP1103-20130426/15364_1 /TAXON_ID=36769 /ORGANISM="Paraphysomonas bandaiensis, Strain Caron Lab Isolate" /LENGTH=518 /DNA_ID=CAMNT_0027563859 /DNA_START=37 /DNA_END=1593 /DNA_ORIENTATION=+